MSKRTSPMTWGLVAVVATTTVLLQPYCVFWVFTQGFAGLDCAEMPPLRVFENVFGHPPPPGLWDIRAAGYMCLGGRDVFLRCSATDDAIRSLTGGSQPVVGAENIEQCIENTRMEFRVPRDHRLALWKQRVRWDEIKRIANPVCYELPPKPLTDPFLTLIVDRSRHLVYVCFTET
jgi:hypothetical protein